MIDKRVIAVIVIFILGGLFIYSFANPADESGNNLPDQNNGGIVTPDENNRDQKKDEIDSTALNAIKEQLANLNADEYTEESWNFIQNQIAEAESQTTQSGLDTIISQINLDMLNKKPVENNPVEIGNSTSGNNTTGSNKQPSGQKPSGSGSNSGNNNPGGSGSNSGNNNPGGSGSNSGNNNPGGSGSNSGNNNPGGSGSNNGNNNPGGSDSGNVTKPQEINKTALDNIKSQLSKLNEHDYTTASWKAIQDQIKVVEAQTEQSKFDTEVAKINLNTLQLRATATKFSVSEKMGSSANIKVVPVNENYIIYKGEMNTNTLTTEDGTTIRDFIIIKIMSPEALSQEEKNNIKMVYDGIGTIPATEFKTDINNQSYIEIYQPFSRSNDGSGSSDNLDSYSFTIYWGYGKTTQYTITIDVAVN